MWYLKIFCLFGVILLVLLFGFVNRDQVMTIKWGFTETAASELNVALTLFGVYGLGILTFFLLSIFREMRLRRRCGQLEREAGRLRSELNALRIAPLEDPAAEDEEA